MRTLVLFARAPRLGAVKTRLEPALGPERTLALHRAFVADQLRLLARYAAEGTRVELSLAPDGGDLPPATGEIPVTSQGPGDLGDRLLRAFRRVNGSGDSRAVVLGADAPTLPRDRIDRAFAALDRGADAAVVPAADGGYVALGIRGEPPPALFAGIPWGTDRVLEATLEAAGRAGVRLARLAPWFDVDLPGDLGRLAGTCRADPARAPATLALLAEWGIDAGGSTVV